MPMGKYGPGGQVFPRVAAALARSQGVGEATFKAAGALSLPLESWSKAAKGTSGGSAPAQSELVGIIQLVLAKLKEWLVRAASREPPEVRSGVTDESTLSSEDRELLDTGRTLRVWNSRERLWNSRERLWNSQIESRSRADREQVYSYRSRSKT